MVERCRSADGIVAGCPGCYNFLTSSAFSQCNAFLRGTRRVSTDARRQTAPSAGSILSAACPSVWYSLCQSHIPYNSEGLGGNDIVREVAEKILADSARNEDVTRQYRNAVWKMCWDMRGDQKWYSLRFGAWFLTLIFHWLYNGEIYVKAEATAALRALAASSTFVYVPTHKSHLDYHMLSFILFSEGLACPHIAAGDNLNLPIVGAIMRTCGAFFIRRSLKGAPDAALYKQVLDTYLHTLLQHGISTEFFIEGGRTRDGRIAVPKLGLLASTVDASLDKPIAKPVSVVPVAISYDLPLEEQGLLLELLGHSKRKETLWQFLSAFGGLVLRLAVYTLLRRTRALGRGGVKGRVAVAFGEPISVHKFLKDRVRRRKKRASGKKGGVKPAASGNDFDEILAEFAALDQPGGGDEDKEGDADGRAASSASRLQDSMPAGSEARRNAVAALGAEIHASLLKINAIPSSALLAASLLPHHAFGLPATQRGGPSPSSSRGRTLATVASNYRWLQGRIAARERTCMQLPTAPSTSASADEFLLALAQACGNYVECSTSAPVGATLSLRTTPVAALWQHARLNYLLPVFGGHGLVASVLLAHARDGEERPPPRGQPARDAWGLACQHPVSSAALVDGVLWLRKLLAPDLDDALGCEVLAVRTHVSTLLYDMEEAGMLAGVASSLDVNGAGNGAAATPLLRPVPSEGRDLTFAGSLLAPVIATYAGVLRLAAELLEGGPQPKAALAGAILARFGADCADVCADDGAPLRPVPSRLLVQNALRSWELEGLLIGASADAVEASPSNSRHGERPISEVVSASSAFNLNMLGSSDGQPKQREANKTKSAAQGGLAQIGEGCLMLAPGSSQRLQDELLRLARHIWWSA